jgi:hypothetical protein
VSCLEFCSNASAIPDNKSSFIPSLHVADIVLNYCAFCNYNESYEYNQRLKNMSCQVQCPHNLCGDGNCFRCDKKNLCRCNGLWGGRCDAYTYFWMPLYIALDYVFFAFAMIGLLVMTIFSCIPELVARIRDCKNYSLRTITVFLVWILNCGIFIAWLLALLDDNERVIWILSNTFNAIVMILLTFSLWCVTILW